MDAGTVIGAAIAALTIIGGLVAWLHKQISQNREDYFDHMGKLEAKLRLTLSAIENDHKDLDKLIAKEYMSSEKTMQMYGIMAQAQDQRMENMGAKLVNIEDKLDTLIMGYNGK